MALGESGRSNFKFRTRIWERERARERERVHLCDRVEACVHQHHHHHHHRRRRRLRRLRLRRFRRHLFKASVDGFQISPTPPPFPLTFLGSIAKATVLNQFLKKKERERGRELDYTTRAKVTFSMKERERFRARLCSCWTGEFLRS